MTDQAKAVEQLQQEIAECRAALQERDLRHRTLLYNLPEKVFHKDRDSVYLSCNQNLASDFGITPEQMVGKTDYDLYPQEMADKYRADDRRIMTSGEMEEIEERYSTPTKKDSIVRTLKAAVKDEHGNVTGVLGIFSDITARKQAEEALRNSERTLRTLIDASPAAIVLLDTEGTVLIANETSAHRLGRTVDEITGHIVFNFMPAEVAASRRKHVAEVIRTGKPIHFEDQRFDRYVENAAYPILDEQGKVAAVAVLAIDQTERKRAEQALKQAHDELEERVKERTAELTKANEELVLFRKFAEASREGFGMSDWDGRIAYVNPTLARLFGEEKPEDVIGKNVSAYYPKEYVQRRKDELVPALLREGHWHMEQTVLPRHGKPISTLQSTFLIRDEKGDPFRIAVVITDITERKQAENKLAYLASFLERNPNPVVEVGLGGDIQYMNPAANGLFPELREQGPSHPWLADWEVVVRPFFEGRTKSTIRSVTVAGGSYQQSFDYVAQDQVVRIYSIDVTELKQAQDSLRQSHAQLRAIYEGIIEGLVITDIETKRFVRVNSSLCRMLGYCEEELLAVSIKDIHPPEQVPNDLRRFQAIAEGRETAQQDRPVLRKDGSIFYADITGHKIVYEGRPCTLAFFHDVTERKRARELLQREQQTLKHLLQSGDHERQTIAYEIHDGLAQYLAGAIMQFQTFDHLKDKKPKLAAKAYDAGMTMLQQGHFEARRLIAGVRPPILDEEGIAAAITHLVNEQSRRKGPNIEYRSKVNFDRLVPILENAIYRIAQEGLANACQHSKSEKVRVSLLQQEDGVRIEIRDWGVGFDTKTVRGNHFGLEGIRQRARLLGGKCSIRSTAGKGTRIAVELPVVLRD